MYNQKPNPAGKAGTFSISADVFPDGMAQTLKAGEVIEFRIVSPPNEQGQVEVAYNTGDEGEKESMSEGMHEEGEEGGDWETEARKALNPQAPENEA